MNGTFSLQKAKDVEARLRTAEEAISSGLIGEGIYWVQMAINIIEKERGIQQTDFRKNG
ncbi:hypothetical protein [Pantoea stewartii]|uniref:hypothetical protein n=1 Tax=Pantoea stewartii TaxID=66269 RepID=UPI001478AFD3|nr:hypothetical protein [Pantoea stewartii]